MVGFVRLFALGITLFALLGVSEVRAQEAKNGGTMTVAYMNEMASLDPAIGYDPASWNLIKAIYDGLLGYEVGTTNVIPNLAESFAVSPDGLTFTFKLRPGVKFQNGRALTAEDVRYSIDRVVDPKTKSPGQEFFGSIVGFSDRAGGKSDRLEGVRAIDDHTVEFKLAHPDASFLQILAINFSFVVPREEVEKAAGDFGKHPVGTGAFKLQEWLPGQQIVLARNPDYFKKGLPHLDKVVVKVGIDPLTAMLQFEKGDVDVLGNGIPPAKFTEAMNDPKYKNNVITDSRLITRYITMKTTMKPFDDKRVRQAVNYAVNKARIVQLINGRADVTNQILPPAMAGYDKDYKGYSYDPQKAKELLGQAGYANGFSTELYATNTDPDPRIAQSIQQDLANVGIKVDLKTLAGPQIVAAGGSPDQAPMVWSGTLGWGADYPDASDFYTPILSCASATKGGWNWAYYCRKDVDAKADAANAIADPAKNAERIAAWQEVYRIVMDDAPWVPVYNDKRFLLKQPRIQGSKAVFAAPTYPLIDYAQVFAADAK
jgi:peptide/nickel transport system substrate-binding protein/oligopeptide transport system substrate-binding protein